MAEREATELLELLDNLRPNMFERIVDKYDTYGSIHQYGYEKFLVNLAKNYGQFVEAVVYNDDIRLKVKGVDIINIVLMILKVMEEN